MSFPIALIVVLSVLLLLVGREWLLLRARQRQRGLLSRWPIPKVSVEQLGPRFHPDELGATREAEVRYVGRGTIRVPGGTSDTEAWILAVLARDAHRMFEFGTCTGKTAYLWAANQPPDGTVVTLTLGPGQVGAYQSAAGDNAVAEAYAKKESGFARYLYTGTDAEARITQLYGDSKRFDEAQYPGAFDVIFVDGSHAYSYVRSDSTKALGMIKPGGVILWHDYSPECEGVFRALNELLSSLPLAHIQGTTLVFHRKPG